MSANPNCISIALTSGFHSGSLTDISIFAKGSYTDCKNSLFKALTDNDFTVTYAFYVGFETDTKYHHYNIDVSKYYETEE